MCVFEQATYQDVQHEGDDACRRHAQDSFLAVALAVDEDQAHVLEVAHRASEELHERVGQPVAGQHLYRVLLDRGDAPVERLHRHEQDVTLSIALGSNRIGEGLGGHCLTNNLQDINSCSLTI